jgi:hypothetical protein
MARPERYDLDYFPHSCKHGKRMMILQNKFKNDGYAVFFKILERLSTTKYHFIDLNNEDEYLYLEAECNVREEYNLMDIIKECARIKFFDQNMFNKYNLIWSDDFFQGAKDAYKRRLNKPLTKEQILSLFKKYGSAENFYFDSDIDEDTIENTTISLDDYIKTIEEELKATPEKIPNKEVIELLYRVNVCGNSQIDSIKPQRKEKKNKVKERKEDIPEEESQPPFDIFSSYFLENGYLKVAASKAYDMYAKNGWRDTNFNPIKNWKVKVQKVWFKPEHKIASESHTPTNVYKKPQALSQKTYE